MIYTASLKNIVLASVNARTVKGCGGRLRTSDEYRVCKECLAVLFRKYRTDNTFPGPVVVWLAIETAKDIDSTIKVILDALQIAEVYKNDKQIDCLHVYRKKIKRGQFEAVNVKVEEIHDWEKACAQRGKSDIITSDEAIEILRGEIK